MAGSNGNRRPVAFQRRAILVNFWQAPALRDVCRATAENSALPASDGQLRPENLMKIHDSVEKILSSKEVFGQTFYEVFFRRFPDVQQHFRDIDMERQSLVLTLAVSIVEQYFTRGYPATEKYLKYLGTQHRKRGIPREVYPMWRDAMLESLQAFLGDEWNEQLAEEWRAAVERATSLMFEGYDEYFRV